MRQMKDALECTGNRADHIEERISKLEYENVEMIRWKRIKNEDLYKVKKPYENSESIRKANIKIMGIPEGEEREKRAESLIK